MKNLSSSLSLIITSFADKKSASAVIRQLVQEHAVACGSMIPAALSIYEWQGKIEEANEVMVLLKTSHSKVEQAKLRLAELHPYEVPEIIALEASDVAPSYFRWLQKVLA